MRNGKLVLDRLFSKSFMEDRGKTQSVGEGGVRPGVVIQSLKEITSEQLFANSMYT